MRRMLGYFTATCVLLLLSTNLFAQNNKIVRSTLEPKMPDVATLYGLDPLAHTFCLSDGEDGHVVQEHEVRNRCSDLDFNWYFANNLTVGNEGGRLGNIIDLGTAVELAQKYRSREGGIPANQLFVSLRIEDENVVVFKDDKTLQPLKEASELLTDGKSSATAPVKLGHIYLIRITDRHDKSFQLFAKILVVAHVPDQSVSIRWQVL